MMTLLVYSISQMQSNMEFLFSAFESNKEKKWCKYQLHSFINVVHYFSYRKQRLQNTWGKGNFPVTVTESHGSLCFLRQTKCPQLPAVNLIPVRDQFLQFEITETLGLRLTAKVVQGCMYSKQDYDSRVTDLLLLMSCKYIHVMPQNYRLVETHLVWPVTASIVLNLGIQLYSQIKRALFT